MMDIVCILKKGGIAILPTDTVYGIVCCATNEEAVDKVYQIKKRSYKKPMVVLVSSMEMLLEYAYIKDSLEEDLIKNYAPLSIILKKKEILPSIVTSQMEEVAIRIPRNERLINIIEQLGKPIIATSCNLSSFDTITNISLLENSIKDKVDYIEDGGEVESVASTIVKVISHKIEIVREGKVAPIIRERYKDKLING